MYILESSSYALTTLHSLPSESYLEIILRYGSFFFTFLKITLCVFVGTSVIRDDEFFWPLMIMVCQVFGYGSISNVAIS